MPRAIWAAIVAASISVGGAEAQKAPWPTAGWTPAAPEEVGFAAGPLDRLSGDIAAGRYGWLDRVVVVRNRYLVWNERWSHDYRDVSRGARSALGCGEGACRDDSEVHPYNYLHPDLHPYYRGQDVHTLQSVTKSVAATVLATAILEGRIPGLDAPLLSFFEAYDLGRVDPRLRRATLDDLLTMRTGIEWHEQDRPLDETNTTLQLERSDDWIRFTLAQPMDAEPGEKWVYNSGGSALIAGVVHAATERHLHDYAEERLFGPLGIDEFHWKLTPTGYPDTEGGLYLEAEQLAKIGVLYLEDGVWDGRRLLPEGWVARATAVRVPAVNAQGYGYGYQWWRIDRRGVEIWAGLGFGGQFLVVLPAYDVVGVVNSWNLFGRFPGVLGPFLDALLDSLE